MDETKVTVTLNDGTRLSGRLTTDHAESSYGQPVFVDDDGNAYDWWQIKLFSVDVQTETRDFTLRVRLTDTERAQLQEAADVAGQSMSEYARRKIFS